MDNFRDDLPSDQYENNIDGELDGGLDRELDASSLLCINVLCVYKYWNIYVCMHVCMV